MTQQRFVLAGDTRRPRREGLQKKAGQGRTCCCRWEKSRAGGIHRATKEQLSFRSTHEMKAHS